MKCERCGQWHQRTFECFNDLKNWEKDKGYSQGKEIICGKCIIEIWGTPSHKIEGETK